MPTRDRLVLLHGALGSSAQVAALSAALAGDYDVVAPDLLGHGAREPADLRLDGLVDDVLLAVDDGAHLVGYSLGGFVALELARRRPARVRSVVTVATKLGWDPDMAAGEVARLDPEVIARKVPAFAAALEQAHPVAGWTDVVRRTATLLTALGAAGSAVPGLGDVACPVRVIVGDRDSLVSVAESLAAARRIPAGELQVLPGIGHPLDRMPVEVLAAAVRDTAARAAQPVAS